MSTKYSISAASRATGKSRNTIAKHLKQRRLSCEVTPQGKLIDASELIRVYGDAFRADRGDDNEAEAGADPKHRREEGPSAGTHSLKQQLKKEVEEREREREHYREQIAQLEQALERAQEGHNRATLLLENHAQGRDGASEWRDAIKRLENRVTELQQEGQGQAKGDWLSLPWWRVLWS